MWSYWIPDGQHPHVDTHQLDMLALPVYTLLYNDHNPNKFCELCVQLTPGFVKSLQTRHFAGFGGFGGFLLPESRVTRESGA